MTRSHFEAAFQASISSTLSASTNQTLALPDDARILVVKLASLGDLLLTQPALRALRRRYPHARLDVLTTRQAAPLLRNSPLVDHVYALGATEDAGTVARLRARLASLALLAQLRATRYDAVALLHHLTLPAGRVKHRALLAAIGARWQAGLDNGHGGFLNVRVLDQGFGAWHEAEYFLAVAEALSASATGLAWPMARAFPARLMARGMVGEGSEVGEVTRVSGEAAPLIAIHPGAGRYSVARRWPLAKFAEVMRTLHAEAGARFVVVGGADEAALRLRLLRTLGYPTWVAAMDDVNDVVRGESVGACLSDDDPQLLADVLRRCDLFIGDDSFPMHMAATVGVPVVAIFGPSNHRAWGPYVAAPGAAGFAGDGADARAVVVRRDDLVCSPCLYRGRRLGMRAGCAPRPCLNELDTAVVAVAAMRLLRHAPNVRREPARQASS